MINNMEQGLISVSNKAVCTTASVAYGWAGAVMRDGPMDGWMDGPTE